MTSQSPASGSAPTDAYADAWASIAHLVAVEGMSWSGRERNRMFLSLEGEEFIDASSVTDTDFIQDGRALGLLDWDADGRVDMLLRNRNAPRLRLLHNRSTTDTHWLQLQLVGSGASNRDAIGATATLTLEGRTMMRSLRAGEGFLSQSSKTLFFGLGGSDQVESLSVRWPDGSEEQFDLGAVDRRYRLIQGSGVGEALVAPQPQQLAAQEQELPANPDLGRISVITKIPMDPFPIPSFDDPDRTVKDLAGRPILINFWSTTCASCIEEFEQIRLKRQKLNRRGLQVVTMLTDDASRFDLAHEILKGVQLDQLAGQASEQTTEAMRILVEEVLGRSVDMPLPVSLLLDEKGQLVQIHVGSLKIGSLLRDLATLDRMDPNNPSASPLAYGRRLAFADRAFLRMAEAFHLADMPILAAYYQKLQGRFQQSPTKH
ncbi:MAG: ASPIC/UnbV domain-containing protein [Planctomycetota bacterium]